MQLGTAQISIVQDIETRRLEAYHGWAYLWSKAPTDPDCADEVAEFYTVTLVRFVEVLETLSAHQRLNLLASSQQHFSSQRKARGAGFLGDYPQAQ